MTHTHPKERGIASRRAAHLRSVAQRPLPFAGRALVLGVDS